MTPRYVFAIGVKFYVASRLANAELARQLIQMLKAEGHINTYDWTQHGRVSVPGDPDYLNEMRMSVCAEDEMKGVNDADVLIALLPGGRGTHCEIGAALGSKKHVILCSGTDLTNEEPYPTAFYFHPGVKRIICADPLVRLEQAVDAVRAYTVESRRRETSTLFGHLYGGVPWRGGE